MAVIEPTKLSLDKAANDVRYETSKWDRLIWERSLQAQVDTVNEVADTLAEKQGLSGMKEFMRETFTRAFSRIDPELVSDSSDKTQWHQAAHEALDDLREWQNLRKRTAGDRWLSSSAAMMLGTSVLSEMEAPEPTDEDRQKGKQEAENFGLTGDAADKHAEKRANDMALQRFNDGLDSSIMRQAMRRATAKAEEACDTVESIRLLPGNDPSGNPETLSDEDMAAMASMAHRNPKLKRIADMAGRLRRISTALRSKDAKHGRSRAFGVELGGDVSRLNPLEYMRYGMGGGMRADLLSRIAGKRALQLAYRGEDKEGRGDVIVLIDSSASMSHFDRELWAKAFGMAILDIAMQQGRSWHMAQWDVGVHVATSMTGRDGANPSITDLLQGLVHFPCGGRTDVDKALDYAIAGDIPNSMELRKADVVLITDGYSRLSETTAKHVKSEDRRLFTIAITGDSNFRIDPRLKTASDYYCEIDPANDADSHNIFAEIAK